MNKFTILISVFAAVVLASAAYIGLKGDKDVANPTVGDESAAEREESIRAAFAPSVDTDGKTTVNKDPELEAELVKFFQELGEAYGGGDASEIQRLFSAETLYAYGEKAGLIDAGSNPLQHAKNRRDFIGGMVQGMSLNSKTFAFSNPRIQRIEVIRDGELIAYVRAHNNVLDAGVKFRWWLLRNPDGQWQAYDYEDLDQSLRISALMGALLRPGGQIAPWTNDFTAMIGAIREIGSGDLIATFERIGTTAEKLLKHKLPKDIEGFALCMLANSHVARGENEDALDVLEQAEKVAPGAAIIHYQRGICLNNSEDHEGALESFGKYVELLGWDADLHESYADCHYLLGNQETSLEHAEKGLADTPNSSGCLASLALALPADRRDEIAGRLEKFGDTEAGYAAILEYAQIVESDEALDHYLAMVKTELPDSPLIEQYSDAEVE